MFCHITTRISTDKNQDLLQKKGGAGFPHMVVMNADGMVLGKIRMRSIEGFSAAITEAAKTNAKLMDLRKKAESDPAAARELLKEEIRLGKFETAAAAQAAIDKVEGLTDAQKKEFAAALSDLKIKEAMKGIRTEADAAAAFGPMAKKGIKPTRGATQVFQTFWIGSLIYAEQQGDIPLFEKALGEMKAVFGNNPRAKGFFDKMNGKLAAMKAKKQ